MPTSLASAPTVVFPLPSSLSKAFRADLPRLCADRGLPPTILPAYDGLTIADGD